MRLQSLLSFAPRTVIKGAVATLTGLSLAALLVQPASAQSTTTFSQFTKRGSGNNVSLTNNGTTTTFTSSSNVNFYYEVANSYNPSATDDTAGNSSILALMTVTSTITTPDTLAGSTFTQPIDSITIQFTAATPVGGNTNLLTATFDTAIVGSGGSATIGSDSNSGQFVTFSSSFLDFTTTVDRNVALGLTSINPMLGQNADGYLNSFTAAFTGGFASNPKPLSPASPPPAVPEPSAPLFAVVGLIGMATLLVRGQRTTKLNFQH